MITTQSVASAGTTRDGMGLSDTDDNVCVLLQQKFLVGTIISYSMQTQDGQVKPHT